VDGTIKYQKPMLIKQNKKIEWQLKQLFEELNYRISNMNSNQNHIGNNTTEKNVL
jgi:hypothetical protein